jgi:limonene-1,2-epoxide hydrolase
MHRVLVAIALLTVAAAGCGGSGSPKEPEDVVRAWSSAINEGDDTKAASLFAKDAKVIQGGLTLRLADARLAKVWNSGLPCAGKIVEATVEGDEVTATFELGERPGHHCDAPGVVAYAIFQVIDGKIVLWHQVDGRAADPSDGQSA